MLKGVPITLAVYCQCISKTDDPNKCVEIRDDYLECLHHRKEVGLNLFESCPSSTFSE